MIEVTIHPEAEAEYEYALGWYLDRSPQAGSRFEIAFDLAIESIRSDPAMFPKCEGNHRFVVLKRYPFRLIYRFANDTACVVAVAHAKRLPGYWSDRISSESENE